ncbi:hypothetical protein PQX77_001282, partial [Marasmius sp. AFHP31]
MAFNNRLSHFLLAIWNTLIALFTLKRTRGYPSDHEKLEIVVQSPIVPGIDSLSTCTGTANAEKLLDEPQMAQGKRKFKKHTRTGARSDIPPPKICVQDWSCVPLDVSNLYEPSKPDLDSWRPELLPDSCLASASPLSVPLVECSNNQIAPKDQTNAAHSKITLKATNPDENCLSPEPNDANLDSLPPIQLFSNDNYSFASSDSAYSSASPQLIITSPATSYVPNTGLSAILYDAPISSILGHPSSIPLPSHSPICYKQTIARKKSQTQCSTVGSLESLSITASTSLFASEPPNSSVTTSPDHEFSRTPYPDIFDFGMYVDIFGSSGSLVGLASFGSVVVCDGNGDGRLSISGPSGLGLDGVGADDAKPAARRHGVMFGTCVLGNTSSPPPSPLGKDVYRSAAYSKAVGSKKLVVGLGIGFGLENQTQTGGDGMRKALLRGVVRRSVSMKTTIKESPSSPVLGTRTGRKDSFDREMRPRATSLVEEGLSLDADAIEERLRVTSWDKSVFDWSEAEFLEMLRHSPIIMIIIILLSWYLLAQLILTAWAEDLSVPSSWDKSTVSKSSREERINRTAEAIDAFIASDALFTSTQPPSNLSNTFWPYGELLALIADFDIFTNQTRYKRIAQERFLPPLQRTTADSGRYGYAATRAYLAYQDEGFLDIAKDYWASNRSMTVTDADVQSRSSPAKPEINSTMSMACSKDGTNYTLAGGTFYNTNQNDLGISTGATADYLTLTVSLATAVPSNLNPDYMTLASQIGQFIRTVLYKGSGILYDGVRVGDPDCPSRQDNIKYALSDIAVTMQSLSLLTSNSNNEDFTDILREVARNATGSTWNSADGVLDTGKVSATGSLKFAEHSQRLLRSCFEL